MAETIELCLEMAEESSKCIASGATTGGSRRLGSSCRFSIHQLVDIVAVFLSDHELAYVVG